MVAANRNNRIPFDGSEPLLPFNRVAERVRLYFAQHPEVAREKFLLEAVRREIDFREQMEHEAGLARRQVEGLPGWSAPRQRLRAEDIRVHAWLTERLAVLRYERYGLWPRLRRFLLGNRLVKWLRHHTPQSEDGRRRWRSA